MLRTEIKVESFEGGATPRNNHLNFPGALKSPSQDKVMARQAMEKMLRRLESYEAEGNVLQIRDM